jgi:hypothetical protein
MLLFFQRLSFTFCLVFGIVIVGIATDTPLHSIDPVLSKRWGFALHDFADGTWYSLFTAALFTNRPLMFWGILPFVGFSVGVYEWLAGPQRTVCLFWLTDLGGTLCITLFIVLPLYLAGTSIGHDLAFSDDVGMSGGGFGCVGGWVNRLPRRWKAGILSAVAAYLVIRIGFFPALFSDLVHIVTFAGGYWSDGMLYGHRLEA